VRVVTLDGRQSSDRQTAWAAADVFCSLSDNIQETFGIAPIEAMAAGLPLVVSDWDGYKDTVRDGVDGFRIPTLMPGPGLGIDLAQRHALDVDTYDLYCGYTSSLVAVDIQATAAAFERLFNSPELRRQMGDAGRRSAREVFDWKIIIGQYEALWARLGEIRRGQAKDLATLAHPWPARMDPFNAFGSYPTAVLTPETVLALVDSDVETALQRARSLRGLTMVSFATQVLPSDDEIVIVLNALGGGRGGLERGPSESTGLGMENKSGATAAALIENVPAPRRAYVFRSLTGLLKLGILKVAGKLQE